MLTITTIDDEIFDFLPEADEIADGMGLSLREALALINFGTSTGPVTFDSSLLGSVFNLDAGHLFSSADIEINGDIDGDMSSDVTINAEVLSSGGGFEAGAFELSGNGRTLTLNHVDIDVDGTAVESVTLSAILVTATDATLTTSGDINSVGMSTGFGDRSQAIFVQVDNFTLNNSGSVVTTGRFAVNADPSTDHFMTINNDGLLESSDDAIVSHRVLSIIQGLFQPRRLLILKGLILEEILAY